MKITLHPTFDEFYSVAQDEVAISNSNVEMRTGGMTTCSALIIIGGGRQLLAHVDANTNTQHLQQAITAHFDLNDPSIKIYLISGDGACGSTELSERKITGALEEIGLNDKCIKDGYTYNCFAKHLVLKNGGHYQDNKRIRNNEIIDQDGLKYVFLTNVLPEHISDISDKKIIHSFGSGPLARTREYNQAIIGPPQGNFANLVGVYQVR